MLLTPYVSAIIVVLSVLTLRPLGLEGEGLLVLVLLIVNSVMLIGRTLPERYLVSRAGLTLFVVGGLASAAILPFASNSFASIFPFFVAGQAGYRFKPAVSLPIAVVISAACSSSLAIAGAHGIGAWPWQAGLGVGLPVLIGYSRRSRVQAAEAEIRERALAERARIARDIHDVLAHSLSGISMQLEVADALLASDKVEGARESVSRARSLAREGLVEARRAVQALRDDALPLVPTLRDLVADAGTLDVQGSPREPSVERAQFLIRSTQEALTNARKHAPGANVAVALLFTTEAVEVTITNGPSTAPSLDVGSGMGLVGLRERAALVGGTATAGPHEGGWQVRVTIES